MSADQWPSPPRESEAPTPPNSSPEGATVVSALGYGLNEPRIVRTYTAGGWQEGQQVIDQTITYDPSSDRWSAVATTMFTDMAGNIYRQGCSTAKATRF